MAPKKSSFNNAQFLKQINQSAQKDVQAVDESQSQKYQELIQGIDKQSQYIDIDLMDDAPSELNDFPRLKDQQPEMYLRTKMSIYEYGVIQTILLLKKNDGRYMIIAGHNRRDICREIIEESKDVPNFDLKKYKFLLSKVFEEGELTPKQIRDYIDETNCLQRDLNKMDQRTKIHLLHRQMENLTNRRYSGGERIDQLCQQMGMEKTSIYDNLAIAEKVIEPLKELYFSCKITRKAVLRFPLFDQITQEWMWDTFGDKMTDTQILQLKKSMSRDEINALFSTTGIKRKRIYFTVPEDREDAVKDLIKVYLQIPGTREQEIMDMLKKMT